MAHTCEVEHLNDCYRSKCQSLVDLSWLDMVTDHGGRGN